MEYRFGMEVLTAEPLQNTNESTLSKDNSLPTEAKAHTSGKSWLFTSEMAKAAAAKSIEARRRREQEANEAKSIVGQLKAAAIVQPDDEYRLERLTRTRKQLEALDEQLDGETDPKCVKSLCDAIARLCDVEQKLAMRPAPGSYRPSKPRADSVSSDATPL